MKTKVYASSIAKAIVLGLLIVVFSLSGATRAQAKSGSANVSLSKPTIAFASIGQQQASRILNSPGVRARLLRILAHNARLDPKSIRLVPKGCGCESVALDESGAGSFASCMRGCLVDAGASYFAVIMCGGSCAFGAVPLCALCLGLTITAVEVCALGCAAYPGPYHVKGFMARGIKRRHATSGSLQAKLRLQPAKGKA